MSAAQAAELAELNSELTALRALLEAVRDVVRVPIPDRCSPENLEAFDLEQRARAIAVENAVRRVLDNPADALTWTAVLRNRDPLPYEAMAAEQPA